MPFHSCTEEKVRSENRVLFLVPGPFDSNLSCAHPDLFEINCHQGKQRSESGEEEEIECLGDQQRVVHVGHQPIQAVARTANTPDVAIELSLTLPLTSSAIAAFRRTALLPVVAE